MKNRTILGVVCIALAAFITFAISPIMSRVANNTVSVVRLKTDIEQGTKISEKELEVVKVNANTLPTGALRETKYVVGKSAASNLYAGDYITDSKLTSISKDADAILSTLNGTKFAMSFTIDSFASGLSGKLKNGDIISLVIKNDSDQTLIPPQFKYCKVITTTTQNGIDQDELEKKDDGSSVQPATVTLLVNEIQAKLLAQYEQSNISCILVYRGSIDNADAFLKKQDEFFENGG